MSTPDTHQAEGEGELDRVLSHVMNRAIEWYEAHESPGDVEMTKRLPNLIQAHIVTRLQAQLDALEAAGPKNHVHSTTHNSDYTIENGYGEPCECILDKFNAANDQWHTTIANKRGELNV